MNTMPGTAKVIAIFVLSLKENVPDVRHYTYFIVRYFFQIIYCTWNSVT